MYASIIIKYIFKNNLQWIQNRPG